MASQGSGAGQMSDLVKRLYALNDGVSRPVSILEREACGKAAAHIEALEADNQRLQSCIDEREEALRTITNPWANQLPRIEALEAALREHSEELAFYRAFFSEVFPDGTKLTINMDTYRKARAALAPEQDK